MTTTLVALSKNSRGTRHDNYIQLHTKTRGVPLLPTVDKRHTPRLAYRVRLKRLATAASSGKEKYPEPTRSFSRAKISKPWLSRGPFLTCIGTEVRKKKTEMVCIQYATPPPLPSPPRLIFFPSFFSHSTVDARPTVLYAVSSVRPALPHLAPVPKNNTQSNRSNAPPPTPAPRGHDVQHADPTPTHFFPSSIFFIAPLL